MSHPFIFARTQPDRDAVVADGGAGARLTYRALEEQANQDAHLLRALGLRRGDCVAAMLGNGTAMFRLAWAAYRAGLYFCAVSTRLTADEARYIVTDSGARAFFSSGSLSPVVADLAVTLPIPVLLDDEGVGGARDWLARADALPTSPIADESAGDVMLYSSGTTGRPKGVKRPLPTGGLLTPSPLVPLFTQVYGANEHSVYLSPAPLYHAAPLGWSMAAHRIGCTVVVME